MSGIAFTEIVLIFVIGLLILGPERLPRVASKIGRWIGKARRTANQLRYQLEREIALSDLQKSMTGEDGKPATPDNQHNESARTNDDEPNLSADDKSADTPESPEPTEKNKNS